MITLDSNPGYRVRYSAREIRGSVGSPYLTFEADLGNGSDYGLFTRDTPFTVDFHGTSYRFIAEPRRLKRGKDDKGNPIRLASIAGISPLALLGSTRNEVVTYTQSTIRSARSLVEQFIGPVTWNILDWSIPAYRFAVDNVSPVEAALLVTDSIGGLIQSNPDGTVRVDWLSPGNARQWLDQSGLRTLIAEDIYTVDEQAGLPLRWNRVTVYDFDPGDDQDELEWVPDELDGLRGILRAYPTPWRTNLRAESTRNGVTLSGGSVTSRTETEEVEFQAGRGQTRYPIYSLSSVDWLDDSLGSVAFEQYYKSLTSSNGAWGYAQVRYTTRSINFNATANEAKSAQLLLVET